MAKSFADISAELKERREQCASELSQLDTAIAALSGNVEVPAAPASKPPARRGRPPGSNGSRSAQAFALVSGQPGITIPEIAAALGIDNNYLYRVMPKLVSEGKVVKEGTGFSPAA